MINALPALQVQMPQNNTLANFDASRRSAIDQKSAQMAQTQQTMQALAVMGLSAMGGDIEGKADPKVWEQVLDHAEASGMSPEALAKFRGRPDLAPVLARGSLDVLKYAQDEKAFDLQLKKFGLELEDAAGTSPAAQLDMKYKQAQIDALNAKPAVTPTDDMKELEVINAERKAAGQPAITMQDYLASKKGGGLSVTLPDGTVVQQGGSTKLTEGQSKDAFYFIRGAGANANLEANEASLTDLKDTVVNGVPLVGNYFTSDGFKNANRDGKEFLAAVLRKDSGGAITPDEWSYYGPMYLPAPGDGPDQLSRKREARQRAMDALKVTSGPGALVIDEYLRQHPELAGTGEAAATPAAPVTVAPPPGAAGAVRSWTDVF